MKILTLLTIPFIFLGNYFISKSFKEFHSSKLRTRILSTASLVLFTFVFAYLLSSELKTLILLPLALISAPIILIDSTSRRIPNTLNLTLATSQTILLIIGNFTIPDIEFTAPLVSGILLFLVFLSLNIISKNRLGMGDVKLSFSVGISTGIFGSEVTLLAVLMSALFSGFYASIVLIFQKAELKDELAFGPFLIFGVWMALVIDNFLMHQMRII